MELGILLAIAACGAVFLIFLILLVIMLRRHCREKTEFQEEQRKAKGHPLHTIPHGSRVSPTSSHEDVKETGKSGVSAANEFSTSFNGFVPRATTAITSPNTNGNGNGSGDHVVHIDGPTGTNGFGAHDNHNHNNHSNMGYNVPITTTKSTRSSVHDRRSVHNDSNTSPHASSAALAVESYAPPDHHLLDNQEQQQQQQQQPQQHMHMEPQHLQPKVLVQPQTPTAGRMSSSSTDNSNVTSPIGAAPMHPLNEETSTSAFPSVNNFAAVAVPLAAPKPAGSPPAQPPAVSLAAQLAAAAALDDLPPPPPPAQDDSATASATSPAPAAAAPAAAAEVPAEETAEEKEARRAKLRQARQKKKDDEWTMLEQALAVIDNMQFD